MVKKMSFIYDKSLVSIKNKQTFFEIADFLYFTSHFYK